MPHNTSIKSRQKPQRLITHSEEFHTDDVFATALLLTLFPEAVVTRSRDDAVIATGDTVYDVGRIYDPNQSRYDHHQTGAAKRSSGITYCSFGLLWKEYGVAYCDGNADVAKYIDQILVMPIDANDNGQSITTPLFENVAPFTIDTIIKIYNPLRWVAADEEHDAQFHKAVKLAQEILARLRKYIEDTLASQKALLAAYNAAEDKRIIVMEQSPDTKGVLEQCPELLYLVSQRPEKSWGVLAVAESANSYTPRRAFPENWRAKPTDELPTITGVPDAVFCHASGFLAVARSREGAIDLARNALGD